MVQRIQRILVADDEEAILFSYHKLLQSALVEVDTCTSIEDAYVLLQTHHYAAVFTDLRFVDSEDEGGIALLQYLRKHSPATPVILMTGYGNEAIKEKVLTLGVTDYLDKPIPFSSLIACLQKLGIPTGES